MKCKKRIGMCLLLGVLFGFASKQIIQAKSRHKKTDLELEHKKDQKIASRDISHRKRNKKTQILEHPIKRSYRSKKRRRFGWGFLTGGTAGGIIAGVASGGAWVPLGIGAGGLFGGFLGRSTAKCDDKE